MDDHVAMALAQIRPCNRELGRMASLYIERTKLDDRRSEAIRDAVSAVQWKLAVSATHLEELWAVSERTRFKLPELVSAATSASRWEEDDVVDATRHLESFLFQSRAYLDIYMRLCCEVLAQRAPVQMSRKAFGKAIVRPLPGAGKRAADVRKHFEETVFGTEGWGTLLRELRDKIAHQNRLRPSSDGAEEVLGHRLDWPTIQKLTYERLAQDFANGSFELLRTTSPLLFELPWRSATFDPGAWDEQPG